MPLKYFCDSWRSLEIPLLNCKVDLKPKWTNYCAFSAAGADNINANANGNINVFTIKDTKILSKILSPRDNQKLSKVLSKGFERSVYWNEYETKRDKNATNEFRYFLKSNFVVVNRLFLLVYLNRDNDVKRVDSKILFTKRHNQKL